MKVVSTLPSHFTDKDVSSANELESPETVGAFHPPHEPKQSLLHLEYTYAFDVPTPSLSVTLKYTKMQI